MENNVRIWAGKGQILLFVALWDRGHSSTSAIEMPNRESLLSRTLPPFGTALGLEALGFGCLHLQGGGVAWHFPLALPGAGLAARLPLYPQVSPGWHPAALCAALPGRGRAPCGLGPPHLFPPPQVKGLCPWMYSGEVPRLG